MCSVCGGIGFACHCHARAMDITLAPVVSRFDTGAVFQGSGNSHFTVDRSQFHETTSVPGLGKAEGLDNGLRSNFIIPDSGF